jgi:Peptidase inhibitor family I36
MIVKRAALGLAAIALAFVAAPSGVAYAGPNDNNNAAVYGGATVHNPNEGCPDGNFCMYTGPDYTGKVFWLYHCHEYDLANWNGVGSYLNSNTGGAHAYIQNRSYGTITDANAYPNGNWYNDHYNFAPAWHVKAC